MTQEPRTTESETRDNATIREIMHSIRDRLTVPDRAVLCLGLVGHLATLMNGRQMEKFMAQLADEAASVQDVPPARQAGLGAHASNRREGMTSSESAETQRSPKQDGGRSADAQQAAGSRSAQDGGDGTGSMHAGGAGQAGGVGQAGRGPINDERTRLL